VLICAYFMFALDCLNKIRMYVCMYVCRPLYVRMYSRLVAGGRIAAASVEQG